MERVDEPPQPKLGVATKETGLGPAYLTLQASVWNIDEIADQLG